MAILNKGTKAAKAETAPKTEAVKAEAPKAEKAPAKKPAARKAPAKKAAAPAAPVVTLTVQYMVEAVKAQVEAEIKTLDLYAKPEEAAVYYVVNGDITGKVEF